MSTEKKYSDVDVIENYGNMFVFEADEHISGYYLIFHDSKEGIVTHADTTFYIEDGQFKLSVDNIDEIDKGYIKYELPNQISCQYSVDLSGNIDLYFNYDNYLNPKFKSLNLYRNSFLHLNKDNIEGILAIAGEYKEKYEIPGAYYLITNLSDSKPKFAFRKLSYEQKQKWIKDRESTYNTDNLIDYVQDNQYLRLKDSKIDVTQDDFINNDNLHLAGGNPVDFDIPIDPDDEVQIKQVDEYVYLYLDCEFTSPDNITGDVGITDSMFLTNVTATLKYNGQTLKHFDGTDAKIDGIYMHGHTSDMKAYGKSYFYPLFLDFKNIVIPNYDGIGGMLFDLKLDDITMANKVVPVIGTSGEATQYGVRATVSFSDNTGYQVVEHDTTRVLGGRKKIYGVYVVVNGSGSFTGKLETLQQTVSQEVYMPELRDVAKGGGSSSGTVKELDYNILNCQQDEGASKLFRIHDIYHMGLSTLGMFQVNGGFNWKTAAGWVSSNIPKKVQDQIDKNQSYLQENKDINRAEYADYVRRAVLKAAKEHNAPYWIFLGACRWGVQSEWQGMGVQYGETDLKSVIFGYDETNKKPYMWIPYSKNKDDYFGLQFAYSGIQISDNFVKASVYENDATADSDEKRWQMANIGGVSTSNSTYRKEIKTENFDFVDIPHGYQAVQYILGDNMGLIDQVKLQCYDIKASNGTIFMQSCIWTPKISSCGEGWGNYTLYMDNEPIPYKATEVLGLSRISYDQFIGTNNRKSSSFTKVGTNLGGDGIYDIEQGYQIFELKYKVVGTGSNKVYDSPSKYDAGLTYMFAGTSETCGNQVFLAQPQLAGIDMEKRISKGSSVVATPQQLANNIDMFRMCCDPIYGDPYKIKGGEKRDLKGYGYDWFINHKIRCMFTTKGYYTWNNGKVENQDFTYTRYSVDTYDGFVLNVVYAGNGKTQETQDDAGSFGESDVMVGIPVNLFNSYEHRVPTYVPVPDMYAFASYNPNVSQQIPETQSVSVFDLFSTMQLESNVQESWSKTYITNSKEWDKHKFYDVKVTIPPVQNITFVCTDSQEDIMDPSSKGRIVAIGTTNGIYYLEDGIPTISSMESGYVKRIVKVHMTTSKYAYIALVDGKLYHSLDDGKTWEPCENNFPEDTVTDITTDIKTSTGNNTAILAGGYLYYGNVVQSKIEKTDQTKNVDTSKLEGQTE